MQRILFLVFSFLMLAPTAQAQEFDLTTLPEGYSFVSHGSGGVTTLTYQGSDNGTFLFDQTFAALDGTSNTTRLRVNRHSQIVASVGSLLAVRYSPHDCAPMLGVCSYLADYGAYVDKLRRETTKQGDVYIIDDFRLVDNTWVFEARNCVTFDEYGFWWDYYVVYADQTEGWGMRDTPDYAQDFNTRLERLKKVCFPPQVTS